MDFVRNSAVNAISIDQIIPVKLGQEIPFPSLAIQGNLDPMSLLVGGERLKSDVYKIMEAFGDQPGFIFNLGHGDKRHKPRECGGLV